jgi:hypothetical protein
MVCKMFNNKYDILPNIDFEIYYLFSENKISLIFVIITEKIVYQSTYLRLFDLSEWLYKTKE